MSSRDRRAEGRRRAWGRGPVILRFEPLEGRQLLSVVLSGSGVGGSTSTASVGSSSASTTSSSTTGSTSTQTTTSTGTGSTTSGSTDVSTAINTAVNQTTGTTATATQSLPDLISTKLSGPAKLTWGQSFHATGTVTNQGTATTTSPFSVDIYASPRSQIVTGAVDLGSVNIPAGLAPGASYQYDLQTKAPNPGLTYLDGQNFYLVAVVDSTNNVVESNENNNVNLGLIGQDAAVVTYGSQAPNLQAAGLSVSPSGVQWGQTLHVTATVANNGDGDAPATNARIVIAPTGKSPTGSLGYTIGSVAIPAISAGTTQTASQDIRLPSTPPSALAGYNSFTVSMITDSTGAANPVQTNPTFQGAGIDQVPLVVASPQPTASKTLQPNLVVAAVDVPSSITWGNTFVAKANLINLDAGAAGPFKVGFYLSESDTANAPLLSLGEFDVAGLNSGQSVSLVQNLQLPSTIPAGLDPSVTAGRIVVKVDPEHAIDDSNLKDNALGSTPVTLNVVGTDGSTTRVVSVSPGLKKTLDNGSSGSTSGNSNTGGTTDTGNTGNTGGDTGTGTTTTGTGTQTGGTGGTTTTPLTPREARIQARQQRMAMLRLYRAERQQARILQLRLYHPGHNSGNKPA